MRKNTNATSARNQAKEDFVFRLYHDLMNGEGAEYLPANFPEMFQEALKGNWTREMSALDKEADDYLNGMDNNGAPWVDPIISASGVLIEAYDLAMSRKAEKEVH